MPCRSEKSSDFSKVQLVQLCTSSCTWSCHLVEIGGQQRLTRGEDVDEYVLFYALYGSVTPREDTWLIDSGPSKHMTGKKKTLSRLEEKSSPQKVSLEDVYQYPIKGIGESSYKLDSGASVKMK